MNGFQRRKKLGNALNVKVLFGIEEKRKRNKMGMFDEIEDTLFCPFCGTKNGYFQTKDLANMLDSWTIEDIKRFGNKGDVINIYNECKKCKEWISINLDLIRMKKPKEVKWQQHKELE